ncbi:hypothetical protein Ark11_1286 [Candidatus Ichthyocystis hellenicum]|uniref:Uncharacterized protein n=3 Tax=Candidatus Ichthyocystis hellenicum TaxID=1561003 RepID=A0A0S4M455_9BURK|nr:hypothetical protein [Candidatus Ichthyocystis hellenicum]CUT18091.1 hypothetical protein Ark11_1286 [Candidatus Ichthyocystis hellenicum]
MSSSIMPAADSSVEIELDSSSSTMSVDLEQSAVESDGMQQASRGGPNGEGSDISLLTQDASSSETRNTVQNRELYSLLLNPDHLYTHPISANVSVKIFARDPVELASILKSISAMSSLSPEEMRGNFVICSRSIMIDSGIEIGEGVRTIRLLSGVRTDPPIICRLLEYTPSGIPLPQAGNLGMGSNTGDNNPIPEDEHIPFPSTSMGFTGSRSSNNDNKTSSARTDLESLLRLIAQERGNYRPGNLAEASDDSEDEVDDIEDDRSRG